MDNQKIKRIVAFVILIVVVIGLIFVIKNHIDKKQIQKNGGIDLNSEEGKNATVEKDDKGNRTIVTPNAKAKTDLTETTTQQQEKFTTSNVQVNVVNGFTTTTGTIQNNDSVAHDVSVQVEFYSDKNRVVGSGNERIDNFQAGTARDFSISTMGEITYSKYNVKVEFIK